MRGKKFRAKNGGWELVVESKWSKGWVCRNLVSGKTHHITEHTLRRYYEPIN